MEIPDLKKSMPDDHCLICGSDPSIIGVFVPEDPEAWGAAPGKTRFIRYCLCSKCQGRQDAPERVEKIIKSQLAGGAIHAE